MTSCVCEQYSLPENSTLSAQASVSYWSGGFMSLRQGVCGVRRGFHLPTPLFIVDRRLCLSVMAGGEYAL